MNFRIGELTKSTLFSALSTRTFVNSLCELSVCMQTRILHFSHISSFVYIIKLIYFRFNSNILNTRQNNNWIHFIEHNFNAYTNDTYFGCFEYTLTDLLKYLLYLLLLWYRSADTDISVRADTFRYQIWWLRFDMIGWIFIFRNIKLYEHFSGINTCYQSEHVYFEKKYLWERSLYDAFVCAHIFVVFALVCLYWYFYKRSLHRMSNGKWNNSSFKDIWNDIYMNTCCLYKIGSY